MFLIYKEYLEDEMKKEDVDDHSDLFELSNNIFSVKMEKYINSIELKIYDEDYKEDSLTMIWVIYSIVV